MDHKIAKKIWTVIAIIGILSMIIFTILPAFQ